jgi:hypothetical protein
MNDQDAVAQAGEQISKLVDGLSATDGLSCLVSVLVSLIVAKFPSNVDAVAKQIGDMIPNYCKMAAATLEDGSFLN